MPDVLARKIKAKGQLPSHCLQQNSCRCKMVRKTEAISLRKGSVKTLLRNVLEITGKHLLKSLYLDKVEGCRQRIWCRCFPKNSSETLHENTNPRVLF